MSRKGYETPDERREQARQRGLSAYNEPKLSPEEKENIAEICRYAGRAPIDQAIPLIVAMVHCYPRCMYTVDYVRLMCSPIGQLLAKAPATHQDMVLLKEVSDGFRQWKTEREQTA